MVVSARTLGIAGAWAASLALVFVLTRPEAPPAAPSPPSGAQTVVVEGPGTERVVMGGGGLSAADVRAAVRAELAAVTAPVTAAPEPEPAPAPDDAALRRADDVLVAAMSDGRWSDDDRDAFRAALGELDRDQRDSLMEIVVPAINAGELTVDTTGSAF